MLQRLAPAGYPISRTLCRMFDGIREASTTPSSTTSPSDVSRLLPSPTSVMSSSSSFGGGKGSYYGVRYIRWVQQQKTLVGVRRATPAWLLERLPVHDPYCYGCCRRSHSLLPTSSCGSSIRSVQIVSSSTVNIRFVRRLDVASSFS